MNPSNVFKKVFVTVGTTKFDKLIKVICSEEIINILKQFGCTELIIQYGNGNDFDTNEIFFNDLKIIKYRLKPNIIDDIKCSDLIISHSGAGSCIEILREHKPLIVVVNEDLMNNHQIELAEKLSEEGYLFYCNPYTLSDTLVNSDFSSIKQYEKGNMKAFIKSIDLLMGFL